MRCIDQKFRTLSRLIKTVAILSFVLVGLLIAGRINLAALVASAATASANTDATLQAQIDVNNQQITDLNKKIAEYQTQLTKIGADKKTLQSAINSLTAQRGKIETQISVTQRQINTTQLQIQQLGSDISDTKKTINQNQIALSESLRNLQKADNQSLIAQILSENNVTDEWNDIGAMSQIQDAINDKVDSLKGQEAKLAASQDASKQKQNTLTTQKQLLTSQQNSLMATKKSKDQLLVLTKAQESKYQALLKTAKAQLASFSAFSQNAGGSGLLSNQTSCDAWGCYYNQRDSLWGNNSLNGTEYRLASDGCLVTSMAMVLTHYGHPSVTPQTINSNPDNFATYYPAYLMFTVYVDGATATRKTATIDATLATGNPVIVGLHAYGGTHFVVLTSGKGGKYLMRDPYLANAKDVNFSDHYSVKNIYEVNKVSVTG